MTRQDHEQERFSREIDGLREILESKIDSLDKALSLVRLRIDAVEQTIRTEVDILQKLQDEKFRGEKELMQVAVQGIKDSFSKTEMATSKQIEQQATVLVTTGGTLNEKINDLKDRLTRIESGGKGAEDAKGISRTNMAFAVAAGVLFVQLLEFIFVRLKAMP